MNRVETYYDSNPDGEWDRLGTHRVEYGITLRALQDHLPPAPSRIVDIGGGVGRYAIELTRRRHDVTITDVSRRCLDLARRKAAEAGMALAGCHRADARDLSAFEDDHFDAALLMGPLYHLLAHSQRLEAVREAQRVLRPGGRVFAAFIARYAVVQYGLAERPEYIAESGEELETILQTGEYRRPEGSSGFIDAWFAHPAEVAPLMEEGGFQPLALLGCECLACFMEEKINAAEDELHEQWLDLLYGLAGEPSLLGGSGHMLYVGCKAP